MSEAVLSVAGLKRSFVQGEVTIDVLRGVDFDLQPGEIVALLGPSGSGKSTLLQAVGLLEGGFEGSIRINGIEAASLDNEGRTKTRREQLGFIYQFHHLLPDFSALENIILPQLVQGRSDAEASERATQLLGALGLGERLDHKPAKLSGGEQQRVAVARALANRPRLILADEPTGALDIDTGTTVMELLDEVAEQSGAALITITHDASVAALARRHYRLDRGVLAPVDVTRVLALTEAEPTRGELGSLRAPSSRPRGSAWR